MAHQGEVIDNPVTGERIEFRSTAAGGGPLRFDYSLAPGGFAVGKVDHVHPRQEERIEVREGELGVRIDGDEWTATRGTRFVIPPETPHFIWNDGASELHARVEVEPPLNMETLFETTFGLARDGETDRRGIPAPLQAAVIADEFSEELVLAFVPAPLQRAGVAALAPLGRLAGYRARYARYSDRAPAEA